MTDKLTAREILEQTHSWLMIKHEVQQTKAVATSDGKIMVQFIEDVQEVPNWASGTWGTRQTDINGQQFTRACSMGAMLLANKMMDPIFVHDSDDVLDRITETDPEFQKAVFYLNKAVLQIGFNTPGDDFPQPAPVRSDLAIWMDRIICYNDVSGRSENEVWSVFERAIKLSIEGE